MRWWKRSTAGVALGAIALLVVPLEASGRGAADSNWAGRWSTTFTSMILTQKGNTVEGHYDWDNGHLTGTVKGNTLTGKWDESPTRSVPDDAGSFVFTLSADGKSFAGKWRNEDDKAWRGDWVGSCESGPSVRGSSTPAPTPTPAPAAGPRPVPLASVANGCGGPGWRSVTGARIHVANTAVFRAPRRAGVHRRLQGRVRPARRGLPGRGREGPAAWDHEGLPRAWSRLRVDTQFQADLRLLCRRAIPAAAVAALASCTAQGGDTASGAAARYAFVRRARAGPCSTPTRTRPASSVQAPGRAPSPRERREPAATVRVPGA